MTGRRQAPRIGILGGTFNPIHFGHLRAAEEVLEALQLERILFIPSSIPPHKQGAQSDPIAAANDRVAWVEHAIADHKAFEIDRIEIERNGPSFLVDTLAAIRQRDTAAPPPVFIVGEDAYAEMGEWRDPQEIFALTDLAVMTRPPGSLSRLEDAIPDIVRGDFEFEANGNRALHRSAGTQIDLVPITALDISSSKIRALKRAGHSIRFLVPEAVREAIERSGVYTGR